MLKSMSISLGNINIKYAMLSSSAHLHSENGIR